MVTRTIFDEGVMAAAESAAKVGDVTDVRLVTPGALQPEAQLHFQVFMVANRKFCFIEDTSFNELKDLLDLRMGSALPQSVSLVLSDACRALALRGFRPSLLTICFAKRSPTTLCGL